MKRGTIISVVLLLTLGIAWLLMRPLVMLMREPRGSPEE